MPGRSVSSRTFRFSAGVHDLLRCAATGPADSGATRLHVGILRRVLMLLGAVRNRAADHGRPQATPSPVLCNAGWRKVGWLDASSVRAPDSKTASRVIVAPVVDGHSVRNRAIRHFIGKPMNESHLAPGSHAAVAVIVRPGGHQEALPHSLRMSQQSPVRLGARTGLQLVRQAPTRIQKGRASGPAAKASDRSAVLEVPTRRADIMSHARNYTTEVGS